jgi:hypothetical protein
VSDLLIDEQALADGWPRLDGTSDHSSVDDAAALGQDVTPDLLGRTIRLRIRDLERKVRKIREQVEAVSSPLRRYPFVTYVEGVSGTPGNALIFPYAPSAPPLAGRSRDPLEPARSCDHDRS